LNTKLFYFFLFALVSTLVNIGLQVPFFMLLDSWWVIYVAMFFGTIAGLITKYYLDKKWVFEYETTSHRDNAQKFGLYSLMGVFTTVVFWGTEMLFFYLFSFDGAQYVGGAIGLAIGYLIKYQLDKKYVFKVAQ
jgi:putative flippase GtrA